MNNRNKITISFLPHDDELWEFIQSKKETTNVSEYVRNLIRKDMLGDSNILNEDKIVERIVQSLQDNKLDLPQNKSETIEDILEHEEVKNTINNLF